MRILEIDEERRRISLSVKRAETGNMPLRDLMPAELTDQVNAAGCRSGRGRPRPRPSEEVFGDAPPPEAPPAGSDPDAEAATRGGQTPKSPRRPSPSPPEGSDPTVAETSEPEPAEGSDPTVAGDADTQGDAEQP